MHGLQTSYTIRTLILYILVYFWRFLNEQLIIFAKDLPIYAYMHNDAKRVNRHYNYIAMHASFLGIIEEEHSHI